MKKTLTAAMRLEYKGPKVLRANQLFTATLRITLKETLNAGARLALAVRHVSDLGDPQMSDPAAENFISVSGPGTWVLEPALEWKRHPWNLGIDLKLSSGSMPAGKTLTVTLGDQTRGSPGYRCQSFAENRFTFRLGIDRNGKGDWLVLPPDKCPAIRITGNKTTSLQVTVARATRPDGALCLHLKPQDAYGNVADQVPSAATLLLNDLVPFKRVTFKSSRATQVRLSVPRSKDWQDVTAATDDGQFWARSNPFGPSPMKGYELFFGDIHGHSNLCDGTNSPEEFYEYARETTGLDFAAMTSHDFELTAKDWKQVQESTRRAHRPGEFVTFLGIEWSGRTENGGDNNIYFFDDDGPLVRSAPYEVYPAWDPAEGEVRDSRKLNEVIEQLRGCRYMVIPHCGGRYCNLDFYNPGVMPLFEIHSCHRTYESFIHETIRRGIRFGFIGGSDDHRGAPGDSHPAGRDRFFGSHNGLAAVWARELTRESIWEAFFARRVYATNGARIALTVQADNTPMGGEIRARQGTRCKLSFWTRLDGFLDRVEVMRDEVLIRKFYGSDNRTGEFAGEMEVESAAEPHAYHVKVLQTDGKWAWSSPIWIAPA